LRGSTVVPLIRRMILKAKRKLWTVISLAVLCVLMITLTINAGRAQRSEFEDPSLADPVEEIAPVEESSPTVKPLSKPAVKPSGRPVGEDWRQFTACVAQPERSPLERSLQSATGRPVGPLVLERFRQTQSTAESPQTAAESAKRVIQPYRPAELIAPIDSTNFGDRFINDLNGNPAQNSPIIVFHETVGSASGTLNFFRTPHNRDADQSSYHTLIRRDGTVLYLVPPDRRAYGAGNSTFPGKNGPEAVRTHPSFPPSVNNFAYHISLETPSDGFDNSPSHSGYTTEQYQSLAWLTAKTGVPDDRITTHKAVDRSGQRMDPRSFSFAKFFQLLQTYTKTNEIPIGCTPPS
jgi:N-acetylmuramoyl-L-alanine amidase